MTQYAWQQQPRANVRDGDETCLSVRDMSKYDYISVSRDEPVPVNKYDSIEWFMYIMLNKEKSLE
jgi:peptide deformylase